MTQCRKEVHLLGIDAPGKRESGIGGSEGVRRLGVGSDADGEKRHRIADFESAQRCVDAQARQPNHEHVHLVLTGSKWESARGVRGFVKRRMADGIFCELQLSNYLNLPTRSFTRTA